jgi:hypothetical protein
MPAPTTTSLHLSDAAPWQWQRAALDTPRQEDACRLISFPCRRSYSRIDSIGYVIATLHEAGVDLAEDVLGTALADPTLARLREILIKLDRDLALGTPREVLAKRGDAEPEMVLFNVDPWGTTMQPPAHARAGVAPDLPPPAEPARVPRP